MSNAATATINLDALRFNFLQVRARAPASKIMAVIKANAYGHGITQVASALRNVVDAFAVAQFGEAIKLRKTGFSQRIVLLQGFANAQQLFTLSELDIDTVIHQFEQLYILQSTELEKPVHGWIKMDTGMHRLGFSIDQFNDVYEQLLKCKSIKEKPCCLSHFSNADDQSDQKTNAQIALFKKLTQSIAAEKSIANSAGILAWPDSHFEWIRPGIMLYGISPFANQYGKDLGLQPVMTLSANVIAIQSIKKGEKIGYGEMWQASINTKIAVLGIGYGDGYPRNAAIGTPVFISGIECPLIGRVSMDSICIDIGEHEISVGDVATLWGDELPIEKIAAAAATIPYELVCRVTERVTRKMKESHG